ncbi:MAG: PIN domain-containing protein [Pirellulaceae bacterium]|jgi:toxin-antitoxin system PIN domain toxin|nr:PIN domain-containing protein [Pirellulaceae bacterium]
MKYLCDSNVFLALAVGQHAHHSLAAKWFAGLSEPDVAQFCRATRISFLRLLTQKLAPDYLPLSNLEAWLVLDRLTEDGATGFESEPAGLDPVWRHLSETQTPSPKVWMDAYLAAFAISGGMRLVTLDKDFRNFESMGLDWLLLSP